MCCASSDEFLWADDARGSLGLRIMLFPLSLQPMAPLNFQQWHIESISWSIEVNATRLRTPVTHELSVKDKAVRLIEKYQLLTYLPWREWKAAASACEVEPLCKNL
jgi:hypothetical protein